MRYAPTSEDSSASVVHFATWSGYATLELVGGRALGPVLEWVPANLDLWTVALDCGGTGTLTATNHSSIPVTAQVALSARSVGLSTAVTEIEIPAGGQVAVPVRFAPSRTGPVGGSRQLSA